MTPTITLKDLTPEQKKAIAQELKEEEKAAKAAKATNKESLKKLENEVAVKHVGFFIFNRNDIEKGIVELFKDLEPIIDLRCEVFGNEK